jgi:hypothetical protein
MAHFFLQILQEKLYTEQDAFEGALIILTFLYKRKGIERNQQK